MLVSTALVVQFCERNITDNLPNEDVLMSFVDGILHEITFL